ncbi:MAG TPA: sigma-70 family RNA polymerase sigma factor [Candidatus Paceibacterota bacterium]|jgi:RNA polymerase sigma-70 factor (ECF subfamily)|nr:sigma-70 family RNA polymerase sigma factor [Candidatus Paceibacterota bacterium]
MKQHDTERERFLQAYDELSDSLFNHCFYRVSDREVALDITQETFTKTWEYMAGGKDIGNLRPFLFRVAGNLIIDYYRKKKSDSLDALQEEGFDVPSEDVERIISSTEGKNALKALEGLDEKYRQVIVMRYIDELSPREIGEIIGETENAVSVRLNRSIKKLKELLNLA